MNHCNDRILANDDVEKMIEAGDSRA